MLGNLCPETVEEAIAMVPSIKVYFDHRLLISFIILACHIPSIRFYFLFGEEIILSTNEKSNKGGVPSLNGTI